MSETILLSARRVLDRTYSEEKSDEGFDTIFFQNGLAEAGNDLVVGIERPTWEEMGEPETITVTVEPGDTLNE